MAQMQDQKSQSHKIEDARDLQTKLYREIGISAVAAALRFTSPTEQQANAKATLDRRPRDGELAA